MVNDFAIANPESEPEVVRATISRNVVKVLQGVQFFNEGKNFKTHTKDLPYLRKYYRYDHKELYDVVYEYVGKSLNLN